MTVTSFPVFVNTGCKIKLTVTTMQGKSSTYPVGLKLMIFKRSRSIGCLTSVKVFD